MKEGKGQCLVHWTWQVLPQRIRSRNSQRPLFIGRRTVLTIVELNFGSTTGYKLRTYGSTRHRSRNLLRTSYLITGCICTERVEGSPGLKVVLSGFYTGRRVQKSDFRTIIFPTEDLSPTPLGERVSVDSVVKTYFQGQFIKGSLFDLKSYRKKPES